MTFGKYWKRLTERNPGLANEDSKITLTVASFRKALEQSFQQGYEDHRSITDAAEKLANLAGGANRKDNPFGPW